LNTILEAAKKPCACT